MKLNSALNAQESSGGRRWSKLDFNPQTWKLFGPYLGGVNLNLGCGRNLEPGFINLDRVAGPGVDVVLDLERLDLDKYFPYGVRQRTNLGETASYDCVLASHVLEHISSLIWVMREIHRVLRPGGFLIAITPHASSDDAWEDPTHVRAFTEKSWMYWDRRLYERDGHHGSYPSPVDFIFEIDKVQLVPREDVIEEMAQHGLTGEAALRFGHRFLRNVIREVHAVLRKVE